jgi:hypothetical protein
LLLTTFPAAVVLKPVSASSTSPLVLSTTPGRLPERICEFPMLKPDASFSATCPKTSVVFRNDRAEPLSVSAVPVGSVGHSVAPRPCSVPALATTGVPEPPPTLRKFTLSMITPEPAPVLLITSDRPVPDAYATLSDRYSCWNAPPAKLIASAFAGAFTSIACTDTTPPPAKPTVPLIAVANDLPATAPCRCTPPTSVTFSAYVPGRTRIAVGFAGPKPSATAWLIAA